MSTKRVARSGRATVRVVLSVEVDVNAWRLEYGEPNLPVAEIRDAVRGAIAEAAATDGIVVPAGIILSVEREDQR